MIETHPKYFHKNRNQLEELWGQLIHKSKTLEEMKISLTSPPLSKKELMFKSRRTRKAWIKDLTLSQALGELIQNKCFNEKLFKITLIIGMMERNLWRCKVSIRSSWMPKIGCRSQVKKILLLMIKNSSQSLILCLNCNNRGQSLWIGRGKEISNNQISSKWQKT